MVKTLRYHYLLLKRKFIYSRLKRDLVFENKTDILKNKKYYEIQLKKLALTTNKIITLKEPN